MITGKMLNSEATLNNFIEIGALEFIAGEELTVVVRLFDDQIGLRYIPVSTCIPTFTLNKSDGDTLSKTGSHNDDDRSIVTFELSETETLDLLGGNMKISLDLLGDATSIKKGIVLNAFARVIDDCSA